MEYGEGPCRKTGRTETKIPGGEKTVQDLKLFLVISEQEARSRFRLFEDFCADHFGEAESLNHIMDEIFKTDYKSVKREWFRDTVYLPFEHL